MNKPSTALQACARAERWSLHQLAQQKLALDASRSDGAARLQALQQCVADAARHQHRLVGGATFRAAELESRHRVFAAAAAELDQAGRRREELEAQASALLAAMGGHRQQKLLLEHVLAQRDQALDELRCARAAHEADALMAARHLV